MEREGKGDQEETRRERREERKDRRRGEKEGGHLRRTDKTYCLETRLIKSVQKASKLSNQR